MIPSAVYEWRAWTDFLLARVLPEAKPIQASVGDEWIRVLDAVPPDIEYFFFQLNSTHSAGFVQDRDLLLSALASRGVRCVNAFAMDASKHALHAACRQLGFPVLQADENGDAGELLILKTDLNVAGTNEEHLTAPERERLGIPAPSDSVLQLLASREPGRLYPILPRAAIPSRWWRDPQIIIERLVENRQDRFIRVHLLLHHATVTDAVCPGPIKKLPQCTKAVHYHFSDTERVSGAEGDVDFPKEVLRNCRVLCSAMKLDYGAFDIVLDDNSNFYFIDVTGTPYAGQREQHPLFDHLRAALTP
jgi:hypothetical protein